FGPLTVLLPNNATSGVRHDQAAPTIRCDVHQASYRNPNRGSQQEGRAARPERQSKDRDKVPIRMRHREIAASDRSAVPFEYLESKSSTLALRHPAMLPTPRVDLSRERLAVFSEHNGGNKPWSVGAKRGQQLRIILRPSGNGIRIQDHDSTR